MPAEPLNLEALGWTSVLQNRFKEFSDQGLEPGRVAVEDKHFYLIITPRGEITGQIAGKLLHDAASTAALPKVGDWVALAPLAGESKAVIHGVLERRTKLCRKVPGRETEEQIMVTNVDVAFVVQALDRTFNPRLLQRHLVMVRESGAKPVVVLNKADLCLDIHAKVAEAKDVAGDAPIVVVSAKTGDGLDSLKQHILPGETSVLIGSSGVGKSTLINDLCGEDLLATGEVRERDSKGRHVTSWRELIALPEGGLVVDTPGMREFQFWAAGGGMLEAFSDLAELATRCHFRECTHTVEKRCAVREAIEAGELSEERFRSYLKLKRELEHLNQAQSQRGRIERKREVKRAQRAFNKIKKAAEED